MRGSDNVTNDASRNQSVETAFPNGSVLQPGEEEKASRARIDAAEVWRDRERHSQASLGGEKVTRVVPKSAVQTSVLTGADQQHTIRKEK